VFCLFVLISHIITKGKRWRTPEDRSVAFLYLLRTPCALCGSHPRSHLSSSFQFSSESSERTTTGQPRRCATVTPCCRDDVVVAPTLPSPRRRRAARAPSPGRGLCSSSASRPQHIPRRVTRAPPPCAEQCSSCSSAKFLKGNHCPEC
jgi:hypothetical protein